MGLDDATIQAFARRLEEARRTRRPIPPLTEEVPDLSVEDGYRVQRALIESRVHAGERVAGWKVGLTSAAPRAQLGLTEPIAGRVLASTVYPDGAAIDTGQLIAPGAEAEIAFLIGHELAGPGATLHGALLAVAGALPALEIVDCRYQEWRFRGPDGAADNGLHAGIVVGTRPMPLGDLDLGVEGLVWEQNGEIVATAAGAEVGGNPLTSVVWLANKLAAWGLALRPGEIVLAGSLSKILRPRPGDTVRARFTRLGSVAARFV
jgi:2-keto-4-pentenoate hydratase